MRSKLEEILRISNNVLYFDDSSDFESALWEIVEIIKTEWFDKDNMPELKYIEKEASNGK